MTERMKESQYKYIVNQLMISKSLLKYNFVAQLRELQSICNLTEKEVMDIGTFIKYSMTMKGITAKLTNTILIEHKRHLYEYMVTEFCKESSVPTNVMTEITKWTNAPLMTYEGEWSLNKSTKPTWDYDRYTRWKWNVPMTDFDKTTIEEVTMIDLSIRWSIKMNYFVNAGDQRIRTREGKVVTAILRNRHIKHTMAWTKKDIPSDDENWIVVWTQKMEDEERDLPFIIKGE